MSWGLREFREVECIAGTRVQRAELPTAAEVAERAAIDAALVAATPRRQHNNNAGEGGTNG